MANLGLENNNPGNLKDPDTGQFRTFDTPEAGQQALLDDIKLKQSGGSSVIKPGASLSDFANVWAPSSDGNDPNNYANTLATNLGVSADTPFDQVPADKLASAIQVAEGTSTMDTTGSSSGQSDQAKPSLTRAQVIENINAMESQGASQQDVQGYLDSLNKETPATPAAPLGDTGAPPAPPPDQTGGASPAPEGSGALGTIVSTAQGGINQAKEGIDTITSGTASPLEGLEAGLKVESGVASTLTSPLAPIFKAITDAVGNSPLAKTISDAITNNPDVQKFAMSNTGQAVERGLGDVANAGNVAGTILGADQVAGGISKVAGKISGESAGITADDLTNSLTSPGKKYLKANPDVIKTIQEEGANPDIITGKNGRPIFNVDAADELLSNKISDIEDNELQPLIQSGNLDGAETINLDKYREIAKANAVDNLKPTGPIDNYFDRIEARYGKNPTAEDMLNAKRIVSKNIKESGFSNPNISTDRIVRSALQQSTEDWAQSSNLPDVHEINQRMAKLIKAQKGLSYLDGKPAPLRGFKAFKAKNPVKAALVKHAVRMGAGAAAGAVLGGEKGAAVGGIVGGQL